MISKQRNAYKKGENRIGNPAFFQQKQRSALKQLYGIISACDLCTMKEELCNKMLSINVDLEASLQIAGNSLSGICMKFRATAHLKAGQQRN